VPPSIRPPFPALLPIPRVRHHPAGIQLLIVPLSPTDNMPWEGQTIMQGVYKLLLYICIVPQ